MKFERATIYKRYHANTSVSYMLVLNVHKRGMSFAYLTENCNNKFYANINDLYIDDIGSYVSIDRTLYLDWSKIVSRHYEKYRDLSGREMRKITMAIKDLYDGIISYDKNGILIYTDMGPETVNIDVEDPKSVAIEKTVTEATIIKSKTVTLASAVDETFPNNGISVESTDASKNDETYIDLLEPIRPLSKGKKYSAHNNSVSRSKNKLNRHIFSESEALAITTMTHSEIIQKYSVSKSIAYIMKYNANKYFGFTNKQNRSGVHDGVTKLFRQGLSIDQIMEQHPEYDIKVVRASYNLYCISKINKTSSIEDLKKLILEGKSIEDMVEIYSLSFVQFCERYKCFRQCAKTIKVALRNILSRNIYFAVFGAEAYGGLYDRIMGCDKNGITNRVDTTNYQTCTRLKDIYETTYDDHFDIITGAKPIPECIRGDDRIRFIEIIRQRCNENIRDRSYNIDQLRLINNRDITGLANILVINYGKANNIIYRKNKSAKA